MQFRRPRRRSRTPSALREWAGVIAALIAVVAFVNVGYTLILIQVSTGQTIEPPEAWSSGMISLSSAALGFLIGKQSTAISDYPPPYESLPPSASGCSLPNCPSKGLQP